MLDKWTLHVFGMTPNQWNVFKFLIIEFVVSVLVHKAYFDLLRTRVRVALERSKCITLWTTTLGRLTPFEYIWWPTSCSDSVNGCRPCRMRAPRFLLIALNIGLLSLILLTELGSGAEQRFVNDKLKGFGSRSESFARSTHLDVTDMDQLTAVHPDPSCVTHTSNSTTIKAFDAEGRCPDNMVAKNESVLLNGACAMITDGFLIKRACNASKIFQLFGSNRPYGFSRFMIKYKRTKTKPFVHGRVQRKFIPNVTDAVETEGFLDSGVVLRPSSNGTVVVPVTTKKQKMTCLLTRTKNKQEGWTARSCYMQYDGEELFFAVSGIRRKHRKEAKNLIPIRIQPDTIIVRKMGHNRRPPGVLVLLHMVEQSKIRKSVKRVQSSIKNRILGQMTDDIVVQILGFTERIGNYEYSFRRREQTQVAVIDVLFLAPMGVLLILVVVIFSVSLLSERSKLPFPITYDEAFDENRSLFLKKDCVRCTCNHESFRHLKPYERHNAELLMEY